MTYNGCLGCVHADTNGLTAAVAFGDGYREIGAAFGMSAMSAHRHATQHLSPDIHHLRRLAEIRGTTTMVSAMARMLPVENPIRVAIINRLRNASEVAHSRR